MISSSTFADQEIPVSATDSLGVELAGLEPATSWVRLSAEGSREVAEGQGTLF
jgi:hypothetical protein